MEVQSYSKYTLVRVRTMNRVRNVRWPMWIQWLSDRSHIDTNFQYCSSWSFWVIIYNTSISLKANQYGRPYMSTYVYIFQLKVQMKVDVLLLAYIISQWCTRELEYLAMYA